MTFISCNTKTDKTIGGNVNTGKEPAFPLNHDVLPLQTFSIFTQKDTVLKTANGAIITIAAGSLETKGDSAGIVIKEAYTLLQMIAAGLSTKTGDEPLSSGGMFYMDAAAGTEVRIRKPMKIKVPAAEKKPGMQLFAGKALDDGRLDWQSPQALKKTAQLPDSIAYGKRLFDLSCASCHGIDQVGSSAGPALAHITRNRSRKYLYAFTRDWEETMSDYCFMLNEQPVNNSAIKNSNTLRDTTVAPASTQMRSIANYSATAMKKFPLLHDEELKAIYDYIEYESEKQKIPYVNDGVMPCLDQCYEYLKAKRRKDSLANARKQIARKYPAQVIRELPGPAPVADTNPGRFNTPVAQPPVRTLKDLVTPIAPASEYYEVEVEAFGWYDVDVLMKESPGLTECQLMVRLQGNFESKLKLLLVVPSQIALVEGGKEGEGYVFASRNGAIFLPLYETCYVIAMGEADGRFWYGNLQFTAQLQNNLQLKPQQMSEQAVTRAIANLGLNELKVKIKEVPAAAQIRALDAQLKEVEQKATPPAGCDCNCVEVSNVRVGAEGYTAQKTP